MEHARGRSFWGEGARGGEVGGKGIEARAWSRAGGPPGSIVGGEWRAAGRHLGGVLVDACVQDIRRPRDMINLELLRLQLRVELVAQIPHTLLERSHVAATAASAGDAEARLHTRGELRGLSGVLVIEADPSHAQLRRAPCPDPKAVQPLRPTRILPVSTHVPRSSTHV